MLVITDQKGDLTQQINAAFMKCIILIHADIVSDVLIQLNCHF